MYTSGAVLADKIVLSAVVCMGPAHLYGDMLHNWAKLSNDSCLLACALISLLHTDASTVSCLCVMNSKKICHILYITFQTSFNTGLTRGLSEIGGKKEGTLCTFAFIQHVKDWSHHLFHSWLLNSLCPLVSIILK